MKPTLFVLAAGMGSRYGGLKQLDGLGPNGETIMDYSVYDACRAGFGKIVFVIRQDFADDFKNIVLKKYEGKVPCEVCFQSVDKVPEGSAYNTERTKPWGTNHALLMGRECIHEPFAVINADDFYGKESFEVLADFLCKVEGCEGQYCMAGYRVGNTLSENGTVSRGVCSTNAEGFLTDVVERTAIERINGTIVFKDENGTMVSLQENTPVSMNMWGFTPEYFDWSETAFRTFLAEHGNELKAEFYIPTVVNDLIVSGKATCKVLDTPAQWFGVTYAQDRAGVVDKINRLIEKGVYPHKLF
ncbi:MAG: nucleotidyltransferase [Paludibacter sp.]|nr:nucleotidyltransferase [Bacteroidales bacterium]MCM1068792.1 nucleotidyltransferase [Prevotella sp.]MCM1353933.1 nucleotidyltransferase [Bacteroides sp.]MCM1443331.1 nucleotidyltransferase [Muribaculum sp.]MCM1482128.1 nucleotidyltransferase [Paludibacter sp.]